MVHGEECKITTTRPVSIPGTLTPSRPLTQEAQLKWQTTIITVQGMVQENKSNEGQCLRLPVVHHALQSADDPFRHHDFRHFHALDRA